MLVCSWAVVASVLLIHDSAAQAKPISITTFERDGIGETGTFEADDRRSSKPGGPPVISSTDKKLTYKHYDIDLTNQSKVEGKDLRVEYVLYTVSADGRLISNAASAEVKSIQPGKRATVKSRGATLVRAKTKTQTIGVGAFNTVQTGSETSRSREKFGGIWIRVYKGEKLVGERKALEPEVEKVKPAWKSPKKGGLPSILEGITLPEITIKPPALPGGAGEKPKLPELPKSLPKPPFGK
jgi:hypothetical protein